MNNPHNKTKKALPFSGWLLGLLFCGGLTTSCIDDATPGGSTLTAELVQNSAQAQEALLRGVASFMTSCYYNGEYGNAGYPGQMYLRDCYCEDFPLYDDSYSYYSYDEAGTSVTYRGYYVMRFYYALINNCNNVIGNVNPATADRQSLQNLGMALGYRALAYMDLARYMEYQPTGYDAIDTEALKQWQCVDKDGQPNHPGFDEKWGCMKHTVSIVTPGMTADQLKNNPRVPYYTMYRFQMKDLNDAEQYLQGFTPSSTVFPNLNVIYGLKARLWLEMATRFELMPEDLDEQLAHDSDNDGYAPLAIASANDCYKQAAEYAQKAMAGYSPMTQEQYQNPTTGFNTAADNSWMWIMRNASQDEFEDLYYYYSYLGQMVSEPTWGMAQYGGLFRCITNRLYAKMDKNDWRRYCWVSEDAAGEQTIPEGYRSNMTNDQWKTMPAYANLKFRSRSMTDNYAGRVADYPLMRMEEMIFIHAEATAKQGNVATAAQEITDFVNNHRQTKATYKCSSADLATFMDDMLTQKRIEFWGEGIMFWDYKRLKKGINRAYTGTNYLESYRMRTNDGVVVPWMNVRFPSEYESKANPAAVGSPDPSQIVKTE